MVESWYRLKSSSACFLVNFEVILNSIQNEGIIITLVISHFALNGLECGQGDTPSPQIKTVELRDFYLFIATKH